VENLVIRLKKKGWESEHIHHVVESIEFSKANRPTSVKILDFFVFWFLLLLIVVANFAISISMIPFLLSLDGIFLYSIVIILGLGFGWVFELIIRSIEHLEKKHHIIIGLVIPLVALVNVYLIAKISAEYETLFYQGIIPNPILVSVVYATMFVLPYFISKLVLGKHYYSDN